jgi:hypothetical protein
MFRLLLNQMSNSDKLALARGHQLKERQVLLEPSTFGKYTETSRKSHTFTSASSVMHMSDGFLRGNICKISTAYFL